MRTVTRRRRVLAFSRAIDRKPRGADELFGSLFASVPNDGLPWTLVDPTSPTGIPGFIDPTRVNVIRWIRIEWQTLDLTLPPPLSVQFVIGGVPSASFAGLGKAFVQAIAEGSPALEQRLLARIPPTPIQNQGLWFTANAINTGVVNPQYVALYLWGWSYPPDINEGL